MILNTRIIILKKTEWKESSYIFQVLSEKKGLTGIIVQGVKKNRSLSEDFQLYHELDVQLSENTQSDLNKVLQVNQFIAPFPSVSYEHFIMMEACTEIVLKLTFPAEDYIPMYKIVTGFIGFFPKVEGGYFLYVIKLYHSLFKLTGHHVFDLRCRLCHQKKAEWVHKLSESTLVCKDCAQSHSINGMAIDMSIINFFTHLDDFWDLHKGYQFNTHQSRLIIDLAIHLIEQEFPSLFYFKALKQLRDVL